MAKLFADAHESETPQRWILEKNMDLFNNTVGLDYAEFEHPNHNTSEISNGLYVKLLEGQLKYLSPINYNDNNFWDNPSTPLPDDGTHGITSATILKPTNQ